jgi:hypothetical protein
MVRTVAAVPKSFAMTNEDPRFVTEFIDSLFPVSAEGFIFDAFISNADVNECNLEGISVPTLIAHTKDDQLASHDASQRAAERIPGARFVSLESGGHLMIAHIAWPLRSAGRVADPEARRSESVGFRDHHRNRTTACDVSTGRERPRREQPSHTHGVGMVGRPSLRDRRSGAATRRRNRGGDFCLPCLW